MSRLRSAGRGVVEDACVGGDYARRQLRNEALCASTFSNYELSRADLRYARLNSQLGSGMDKKSDSDGKWPTALWVGVGLSVVWLAILIVYATSPTVEASNGTAESISRWRAFWQSPPNNFGDALAGIFAPLAFLWLVVATFLQRSELEQNREALFLQAKELKATVEELHHQTENQRRANENDQSRIEVERLTRLSETFEKETYGMMRTLNWIDADHEANKALEELETRRQFSSVRTDILIWLDDNQSRISVADISVADQKDARSWTLFLNRSALFCVRAGRIEKRSAALIYEEFTDLHGHLVFGGMLKKRMETYWLAFPQTAELLKATSIDHA